MADSWTSASSPRIRVTAGRSRPSPAAPRTPRGASSGRGRRHAAARGGSRARRRSRGRGPGRRGRRRRTRRRVEPGRRPARRRRAGALARRVEDDEVEGLVVRRRQHPVDAVRTRRRRPVAGEVGAGVPTGGPVGLHGDHAPVGPVSSPTKRGEEPDTGVQVEHPLPRLRVQQRPGPSRPAPTGRRGAPARSRRASTAKSRPSTVSTIGRRRARRAAGVGARDEAVVDRDDVVASGARAARGARRGAGAYCIRVRQRRPWSSPGTGSTTTGDQRLEPAPAGRSCSRTTAALSVALRGQRDVLEVAAAAQAGARVRGRAPRRGRRTASAPRRRRRARTGRPRCPR